MSNSQTAVRPNSEFAAPATRERLERVATALRENGFRALIAADQEEARQLVLEQLPDGAQVHQGASVTLDVLGVTADIEQSGRYAAVRPGLYALDRETQMNEIRRLGASPDYMLGSVHAVTDEGSLVVASASGSQIGAYASGAGHVVLAVGSQKVVTDLESAFRRINEYTFLLEDERAQEAYGVHSAIRQLLVINGDPAGRITVILIDEALGF